MQLVAHETLDLGILVRVQAPEPNHLGGLGDRVIVRWKKRSVGFAGGLLLAVVLTALPVGAQSIGERLGLGKKSPSNEKIASGLKEALTIGTGNAVSQTGRVDGYFGNAAIKILMPEKLRTLEKGLRAAGQGAKIDEFVLSMNRAAERAAPQAKEIFWGAIKEMTFDDARKIFTGGDTAATEYFKSKTTEKLTTAFRPIVAQATQEVGVTRQYKELTGRMASLPFANTRSLDIDEYVVGKSLDGLFSVLAQEEKKIRTQPAARVTSLLQEVFGRARK